MRRAKGTGLETLGGVLRRDGDLRTPPSVEASPVSARDWEAAVGTRIAARARPVRLERGVLLVIAASATWAQELALLGDAIVEQLAARGVPVKSLRFRVGEVAAPPRIEAREPPRVEPPSAPLPRDVEHELARVGDLDLRATIARAAAKNLGWQAVRPTSKRR